MGGFKEMLLSGELVQLAIAVVIGAAFTNLITTFTSGLITPWLGIFGKEPAFDGLYFTINGSVFRYGNFIDALISFLIISLIIYYAVVVPFTWIRKKLKIDEESNQTTCTYCYSKVPKKATKCAYCTSTLEPEPEVEVLTKEENVEGHSKFKAVYNKYFTKEIVK